MNNRAIAATAGSGLYRVLTGLLPVSHKKGRPTGARTNRVRRDGQSWGNAQRARGEDWRATSSRESARRAFPVMGNFWLWFSTDARFLCVSG